MNLLIFNNVSKMSTVLDAILKVAESEFDEITVVFPEAKDFKSIYGNSMNNVDFVSPNHSDKIRAALATVFDIFSKNTIQDFVLAKANKKMCFHYLKTYILTLLSSELLFATGCRFLKKDKNNTVVFSTWYSNNAIAAAKIKQKNPEIYAASYAHSYEVDSLKNPYIGIVFDRYKEKYLDRVFFISETVMDNYIKENESVLKHCDKYSALHFGSTKKNPGMAKVSEDGVFRIVTCSGLSPVKRLDVLAEALEMYSKDVPIEWTIIGDGPDKEKIRNIISRYNNNVSVNFVGKVNNDEVHKYYSKSIVDLFVNVSLSEGLPVSIMEAMSYGIPAMATRAGGNHEIVTDETGYPIELEISSQKLCEYIEKIVCDIASCNKKREAAYEMWYNGYRVEENVGTLLGMLKND